MNHAATLRPGPDAGRDHQFALSPTSEARRGARSLSGGLEVVVLIVIAALLVLGVVVTSPRSASEPSLTALKVSVGDSLWTLAAAHPVDGLTTAEVSELLMEANHLEGPLVSPGQILLVPVESPGRRLAAR